MAKPIEVTEPKGKKLLLKRNRIGALPAHGKKLFVFNFQDLQKNFSNK